MSKIRKEEMIMLKKKYYIGLDQGTTGTTTLLLDEKWNVVARGYKEHKQYYPKPGWVEHDPMEIWQRVIESVDMALSIGGVRSQESRFTMRSYGRIAGWRDTPMTLRKSTES